MSLAKRVFWDQNSHVTHLRSCQRRGGRLRWVKKHNPQGVFNIRCGKMSFIPLTNFLGFNPPSHSFLSTISSFSNDDVEDCQNHLRIHTFFPAASSFSHDVIEFVRIFFAAIHVPHHIFLFV
jgi:hypothetical protein